MSWSSLPDDMVKEILAGIPLVDLAGITMTSRSFHTYFRDRLAREQRTYRKLAVDSFGDKRIARLFALMEALFRGKGLGPGFIKRGWNKKCWISADGTLHGPDPSADRDTSDAGDICVRVLPGAKNSTRRPSESRMRVEAGSTWCLLELHIRHYANNRATITLFPKHDGDLEPAALVQALLSGGLAQFVLDVGHHVEVAIEWSDVVSQVTQAGSKAQLGPLLPFASRYRLLDRTREAKGVKECMQIRQMGPASRSGSWKRGLKRGSQVLQSPSQRHFTSRLLKKGKNI